MNITTPCNAPGIAVRTSSLAQQAGLDRKTHVPEALSFLTDKRLRLQQIAEELEVRLGMVLLPAAPSELVKGEAMEQKVSLAQCIFEEGFAHRQGCRCAFRRSATHSAVRSFHEFCFSSKEDCQQGRRTDEECRCHSCKRQSQCIASGKKGEPRAQEGRRQIEI